MPIPFLNSIKLNKNQVEDFCVFNYSGDPTLSSGADFGYLWLNTSATPKVLKFWDGTNYRTLIDSTTISSSTAGTANDLSGGVAGSLPYQQGVGDTTFLGIGSSGYILTSTGSAPQWSASIPSSSVSGLAASATTDTTNASNISSGTLGLARLSLASGQFYVGDGSNNPAATAKSSIPLSGFGNAAADINIGGFKITNSGTIGSGDADSTVATKGYVDSVAQGLDVKASCLVATTADITLASPGAVTIDGIYSATDFTAGTTRILVKDQSAPAENGIYIWQGPSSAMTRSADANTWDELVGAFTFVERGTANADSGWVCTVNAGGTLGSTAVTWVKFSQAGSYTAGNGIVQSGTSFNFAQSSAYTAGQIPFASSTTAMGFSANLFWDNSNNRLGIGTATPTYPLSVNGRISYIGAIGEGADTTLSSSGTGLLHGNSSYWTEQRFYAAGNEQHRIASLGVFSWYDGAGGTRMTLNGTGLGIGASPSTNLHVYGAAPRAMIENSANTGIYLRLKRPNKEYIVALDINNNGGNDFTIWDNTASASRLTIDNVGNVGIGTATPAVKVQVDNNGQSEVRIRNTSGSGIAALALVAGAQQSNPWYLYADSSRNLIFQDGGSDRARIDSTGNLGLGVTPSASWGSGGNFVIGATKAIASSGDAINIYNNCYYNGGFYRTSNGFASVYYQYQGAHVWSTAGNGNAGTSFTPTTQMTLDASGNLGLGVTPFSWSTGIKAFDFGSTGSIYSVSDAVFAHNAYVNTSGSWTYKTTAGAGYYQQFSSAHKWFRSTDATPTAGNAITWTQAMTLDASGNLGLGVTPNAWTLPAFQSTYGVYSGTSEFNTSANAYYDGQWKHISNAAATRYSHAAGVHYWFNKSAGTGVIAWTQAMTLFSSGALSLGTASDALSQPGNVYLHGDSGSGKGATIAFGQAGAVLGCIGQLARIVGGGTSQDIFIQSQGTSNNVGINAYPSGAVIYFQTQGTERLRIKSTGQVNFVGLASDPAGAAGDVVYNSTSNRLKYHNGTAWVNTGTNKYSGALAGTGTSFTVTHNLGTRDVTVAVRKSGSTYDQVFTDVQMTTDNTVTIVFASSVTGSDYTVTVIG